MRRGGWIVALLFLVACEGVPELDALFGPGGDRATLANGQITIAGPTGYCPDRSATTGSGAASLVVLGSCASVRNNPNAPAPHIPGVLTASVSRISGVDLSGSSRQLERFFRSDAGRAAVSRDGNAGSVRILSTRRQNGAFVLNIRDASPGALAGLSPDYWRAIFDLKGRLVTLSVIAFEANPMSGAFARATLDGFINRIRQENANPVDGEQDG